MGDFVLGADGVMLIDLLDDKKKARLMDAICAHVRGEEPTGLDEATGIVFASLKMSNEKKSLITKSSQTLDVSTENQERIKEKVCSNEHTKEKKERMPGPLMADDSVLSAFEEFAKMRKMIKKPLTDLAKNRAMNKLAKLSNGDPKTAVMILEQSTDHCWQDLYELKDAAPAAVTNTATKTQTLYGHRSDKVQRAFGFSTERTDTNYNDLVWANIRKGWEEDASGEV